MNLAYKLNRLAAIGFFQLLVLSPLCSQENDQLQVLQNRIDSIVQVGLDSMAFPGSQVYISVGGKTLIDKAYGYHTFEGLQKVRIDDLYDLASVTKVSSGLTLLMKLHGEGKFDLDAELGTYTSALSQSNKSGLIIRDILTHQAGLQAYIVFWKKLVNKNGKIKRKAIRKRASKKHKLKIDQNHFLSNNYKKKMVKEIEESPLGPHGNYLYSGLFFLLLPDIIESLIHSSYETYLQSEIYDIIGATTLCYNPSDKFSMKRIVPTEYDGVFRHKLVHGYVHDEAASMLGGVSCNAGLFSNAADLAKLFQLYLNEGKWGNKTIINPQSIKEFTSYQFAEQGNHRGLGFDKPLLEYDERAFYVARDASPQSFGHSGFTGTFVWADPVSDVVVVFLSNRVNPTRDNRKLYNLGIRSAIHQSVYDYLKEVTIEN